MSPNTRLQDQIQVWEETPPTHTHTSDRDKDRMIDRRTSFPPSRVRSATHAVTGEKTPAPRPRAPDSYVQKQRHLDRRRHGQTKTDRRADALPKWHAAGSAAIFESGPRARLQTLRGGGTGPRVPAPYLSVLLSLGVSCKWLQILIFSVYFVLCPCLFFCRTAGPSAQVPLPGAAEGQRNFRTGTPSWPARARPLARARWPQRRVPSRGRDGAGRGGARAGRGQRRSHSLARAAGAPSCSLPGLCSRLTAGVALTSWLPCAHSPRESDFAVFSLSLHHTPLGSSRLLSLSLPFSCLSHLALSPRFPLSLPAFCSPSHFLYLFSAFLSTATSYQ